MSKLLYDLRQLCRHNRDGNFLTQANRKAMLRMMADQLRAMHYVQMRARDLKGRHVDKLWTLWRMQGLSDRTLANRFAVLRWWCEKVDRVSVMPKTNACYGLAPRASAATVSHAWHLDDALLAQVEDPCVQMSFALQREFGLRRKESILLRPWRADQGDVLMLEGSWCKNGRPRTIPLSWAAQRVVLERAKQLVRFASHALIPSDLRYDQQRNRYDAWACKLGVPPLHGLRHQYAARRYQMLAGWPCPLQGGPTRETMTETQCQHDRVVRQQLAYELGHNRVTIVGMYVGL